MEKGNYKNYYKARSGLNQDVTSRAKQFLFGNVTSIIVFCTGFLLIHLLMYLN